MNPNGNLIPLADNIRSRALVVGVVFAAAAVVGAYFDRLAFDRAYLFSYVFFFGLSIGSLALLMLHRQVGGAWGFLIRRPLESGAMCLIPMALLFAPILVDLDNIYPWVSRDKPGAEAHQERFQSEHHGESKANPKGNERPAGEVQPIKGVPLGTPPGKMEKATADLFAFKKSWLDPVNFTIRVAIYFAIWITLALIFNIGSRRQDRTHSADLAYGLNGLGAPGLVAYFLTVSFAMVDWGMSLEPHWYSTLYGVLLIIGQGVSTIAFMILVASMFAKHGQEEVAGLATPETYNDLGNLLLAFTMFWGYLSFSQFLIIWAGNLAEETPWYMRRVHNGWQIIGLFEMVFHFFAPFLVLLCRPVKRNITWLKWVAGLIFVVHLIDDFWLFAASPAFDPIGPDGKVIDTPSIRVTWLDFVVPLGLGGLWLSAFLTFLKWKPLVVAYDPQLEPAFVQASGGH